MTSAAEESELLIERVLPAPRPLVYEVWSQPQHLVNWWGPKDFTVTSCSADVRVGGRYRICIRSPEGSDYWMEGEYRELTAPERLVFSFAWDEEPRVNTLVSVTFEEHAGGTLMTFRQSPFPSADDRDSHRGGWSECFDRLREYLSDVRLVEENDHEEDISR